MNNQNKIQITKQGLDSLKKELDELANVKRPIVVDRLSNARSQGDLAENSDYHSAKEELEFLDGRIEELEQVVKNSVVSTATNGNSSVSLGNSVKLKIDGTEETFFIVGEWEANPMEKKISNTSPLGSALMGKKVGSKVEVEAPAGRITYEILAIK